MTEEQPMTEEQEPTEQATVTMNVTGVVPIDLDTGDRKYGFVLMTDGTVRWAELTNSENGED
jgi:hypothetical protein